MMASRSYDMLSNSKSLVNEHSCMHALAGSIASWRAKPRSLMSCLSNASWEWRGDRVGEHRLPMGSSPENTYASFGRIKRSALSLRCTANERLLISIQLEEIEVAVIAFTDRKSLSVATGHRVVPIRRTVFVYFVSIKEANESIRLFLALQHH
jgi:hypothetical protein